MTQEEFSMHDHTTFQPRLLRGKAALITGGGSGINRQIAATYAAAGAAVAIVGRDGDKAARAAREIEAEGGRAIGLAADVRDYGALRGVAEQAHAWAWPLDIVVAGAAGNFVATATGMSANGFRAVVDTDLGACAAEGIEAKRPKAEDRWVVPTSPGWPPGRRR